MNKNAHLVLVLDRSGSMNRTREDTEGGVNAFIEEQKKIDGNVTVSIVQFDTEYEYVCKNVDINEVKPYSLNPRGATALLDAIGQSVSETGEYLKSLKEEDRPGLVSVMIVTDGLENASQEYDKKQISEIIKHQQDTYNWQFSYLGANQDAFQVGGQLGFKTGDIGTYSEVKTSAAYSGMSAKFGRSRKAVLRSNSAEEAQFELGQVSNYTQDELKDMEE